LPWEAFLDFSNHCPGLLFTFPTAFEITDSYILWLTDISCTL
jgi:hypothetical protein